MPAPSTRDQIERFVLLQGDISAPTWLDDDGFRVGDRASATMVQLERRVTTGGICRINLDLEDLADLARRLGLSEEALT